MLLTLYLCCNLDLYTKKGITVIDLFKIVIHLLARLAHDIDKSQACSAFVRDEARLQSFAVNVFSSSLEKELISSSLVLSAGTRSRVM